MNSQAHRLSAFAAVAHLLIGVPELLRIGPRFLPPSWQVVYMLLPDGWDWTYPGLWAFAGLTFLFGMRWPSSLRLGFRLSALLFLSWGIAGIPAYTLGLGGNIPGAAANLFIAGCAWVLGHYVTLGERGNAVNLQVARLAEQARTAQTDLDHGQ